MAPCGGSHIAKAVEEAHIASLDAYCRRQRAPTGQVANGRWPRRNAGCECLYSDREALQLHKAYDCSPACTPRWSQSLVNVMSGSAEPCAYCAKYAAGHCIGLGAFPDLETQQQQRRLELEAQHRSSGTLPPPPPTTSGSNRLLQAFDEGDMPYYYYKDTSHTLACKYELYSTPASPIPSGRAIRHSRCSCHRGQMATGAL